MAKLGYIPFQQYTDLDALNASFLRAAEQYSFAHAEYQRRNHISKPAFVLGSALHCITLEPERFRTDYACAPKIDKRTKDGKAEWAKWQADYPNAEILSAEEDAAVKGMHAALLANKTARALLVDYPGSNEQSFTFAYDGVACKARLDRYVHMPKFKEAVVDLKTTTCAQHDKMRWSVRDYGYHISAEFYRQAALQNELNPAHHILVCVESAPPYGVKCFEMSPVWLEFAAGRIAELVAQYKGCIETGVWTGYPEGVDVLEALPGMVIEASL